MALHHCFEGLIAVDLEVLARAHYCRDMWATSGEPSWLRELGVERAHAAFPHSSGIDELQAPAPDAALYRLLRDGDPRGPQDLLHGFDSGPFKTPAGGPKPTNALDCGSLSGGGPETFLLRVPMQV